MQSNHQKERFEEIIIHARKEKDGIGKRMCYANCPRNEEAILGKKFLKQSC